MRGLKQPAPEVVMLLCGWAVMLVTSTALTAAESPPKTALKTESFDRDLGECVGHWSGCLLGVEDEGALLGVKRARRRFVLSGGNGLELLDERRGLRVAAATAAMTRAVARKDDLPKNSPPSKPRLPSLPPPPLKPAPWPTKPLPRSRRQNRSTTNSRRSIKN